MAKKVSCVIGGYNIEDLAEKPPSPRFATVALWQLPNATQSKDFAASLTQHTLVHEIWLRYLRYSLQVRTLWASYDHDFGAVIVLSRFFNPNKSPEATNLTIIRLLAKMPTLCAMIQKKAKATLYYYPQNRFDTLPTFHVYTWPLVM